MTVTRYREGSGGGVEGVTVGWWLVRLVGFSHGDKRL